MDKVSFQTLISEISQAIHNTQLIMEKTKMQHFLSYFTEEENAIRAKTIDIKVGISECGEIKEGRFSIPTATLVSHNGLSMDSVEVNIRTTLASSDSGIMAQIGHDDNKESTEDESTGNDSNQCEIKLVFKNKHASEGINQAVSLLSKSI